MNAATAESVAAMRRASDHASGRVDVEFPLPTRRTDDPHRRGDARGGLDGTAVARAPLPFLVRVLLAAEGPFGLEVERKSDDRVVGQWGVDVNLRDPEGTYVSQARGSLYVCASAKGDERSTGIFLVVRQWWVNDYAPARADALYGGLSTAVLERLDALLGSAQVESGDSRSCELILVDGRRLARRRFRLESLQARILRDFEVDLPIAGIDLRVACGRGIGISASQSSTLPAPLSPSDPVPTAPAPLASGVFVAETVSPANALWNRRASDKARPPARPYAPAAVRAKAR